MIRTTIFSLLLILTVPPLSFSQDERVTEYICPMYCTDEVSHDPESTCSVCRMNLEDRSVVENPTTHKIIFPKEAWSMAEKDSSVLFLDVRTEREYNGATGRIKGALLMPIGTLESRVGELSTHKKKTILTYCSHGIRSARAAQLLEKQGYKAISVAGGTTKWARDGLPLENRR